MIKDLQEGTPVALKRLVKAGKKTTPPPRFTETRLLAELDSRGIGRPATFASIVSLIQERGYVQKVKGQQLAPTPLGFAVVQLLMKKFPTFTAYEYTASMEEELEEVAAGKKTREKFLADFWRGPKGFEKVLAGMRENIDWEEVREATTVDLHNGYSITYSKFGAFLQHDEGVKDEKGYLPSAKLDDLALAEDFLDPEVCATYLATAKRGQEVHTLGVLAGGQYEGWTVIAREGRFGPYLQASPPEGKKDKPINQALPEGLEAATVTLPEVEGLFAEVKLPRWSPDGKWLVGLGKRGPYMGRKATVRSKKVDFKSLPEGMDPRTVTFEEVKKLWEES